MYVCTLTHLYLSVYLSTCQFLRVTICVCMQLDGVCTDVSSSDCDHLPLPIWNLPLHQWEPGLPPSPSICRTVEFWCPCVAVLGLGACATVGKTQLEYSVYVQLLVLWFCRQHSFSKWLESAPFFLSLQGASFTHLHTVRVSCHSLRSILGFSQPLKWFFQCACIKIHSSCCPVHWVLVQAQNYASTPTVSHRIVSLPSKRPLGFTYLDFPPLPHATGTHWSVHSPYTVAFSRRSYMFFF